MSALETELHQIQRNRELDFLMRQLSQVEGWPDGYASHLLLLHVESGATETWIDIYRHKQAKHV